MYIGCVPLVRSEVGSVIQDHSYHGASVKGTDESSLGKDSLVPLMHHNPNQTTIPLPSQLYFVRYGWSQYNKRPQGRSQIETE